MKRPDGAEHRTLLLLLVFWNPMGPNDTSQRQDQVVGGHLFNITDVRYQFEFRKPRSWKINPKFTELWVFSILSYLRSITNEISEPLELPMPNATKKMQALLRVAQVPLQSSQPQLTHHWRRGLHPPLRLAVGQERHTPHQAHGTRPFPTLGGHAQDPRQGLSVDPA